MPMQCINCSTCLQLTCIGAIPHIYAIDRNQKHVGDKEDPNIQGMQCGVRHRNIGKTHGSPDDRAKVHLGVVLIGEACTEP